VLQWPIRKLFYDTFCIGQTKSEITANISALRSRGINGVVLAFPREAKLGEAVPATRLVEDDPCLKSWVSSNLDTIDQVGPGDYIAVKFTGAGPAAVKALEDFSKAQPGDRTRAAEGLSVLQDATFEICRAAEKKGVKVMVDAESSVHQPGIDHLTLVRSFEMSIETTTKSSRNPWRSLTRPTRLWYTTHTKCMFRRTEPVLWDTVAVIDI
jgi:hypothetical protein